MKSEKDVPIDISKNLIRKMLESNENRLCADCNSQGVTHASVDHGTFICSFCAESQNNLKIATIKDLNSDIWELYELKLLISGGNPAFRDFFGYYSLLDVPISIKYRTKAAYFYREVLNILSQGRSYEENYPSIEEGTEVYEELDLDCDSTCNTIENNRSKWTRFKDLYLNYPKIQKEGKEVVNKSVKKIKELARVEDIVYSAKKSFEGLASRNVAREAQKVFNDIEKKILSFGGEYFKAFGACKNPKVNFDD